MKIVVSPAKTLDYNTKLPTSRGTQPSFLETTATINRKLARMSKQEIADLMHISDKLADLNYSRYQEFEEEHNKKNARPAAYAFAGDVYTGLDAYTIPTEKIRFFAGYSAHPFRFLRNPSAAGSYPAVPALKWELRFQ